MQIELRMKMNQQGLSLVERVKLLQRSESKCEDVSCLVFDTLRI